MVGVGLQAPQIKLLHGSCMADSFWLLGFGVMKRIPGLNLIPDFFPLPAPGLVPAPGMICGKTQAMTLNWACQMSTAEGTVFPISGAVRMVLLISGCVLISPLVCQMRQEMCHMTRWWRKLTGNEKHKLLQHMQTTLHLPQLQPDCKKSSSVLPPYSLPFSVPLENLKSLEYLGYHLM